MFIGIDVGTTLCKAVLFSQDGRCVKTERVDYNRQNSQEISADAIYSAVCTVLRNLNLKEYNEPVMTLGVTTFGETFVLLDKNDQPIADAILYGDLRGNKELAKLCESVGAEYIYDHMGIKPHGMFSAAKLHWIKLYKPDQLQKTKHIMLFEDYLLYKLGGSPYIDYSLASRTMMFDINKLHWDERILNALGIDKDMLSTPVPSGTIIGKIKRSLAEELNLPVELELITGGHDQICAAIGAGITSPGDAVMGMGTVECVTPVFPGDRISRDLILNNFAMVPFPVSGYYTTYMFNFAGALVNWFRDNFKREFSPVAKEIGLDIYGYLDNNIPSAPGKVFVMPQFNGSFTPDMDYNFRGTILNLDTGTTEYDIYRSLLEGITYETLYNINIFEQKGLSIKNLYATGGGSRSDKWLEIKANIIGKPVIALQESEAGAAGVAILAGVAKGVYSSLEEGAKHFVKVRKTIYPDKEMQKVYAALFERYKSYREILKKLYSVQKEPI